MEKQEIDTIIDKYIEELPDCNVCKKEKATCMNNTVCPKCVKVLIKNLAGVRPSPVEIGSDDASN